MERPWTSGPLELLLHGLGHLEEASGFDQRMAMICIDNAVELMMKTYLGLPKRVTGIEGLTRARKEEMFKNFPALLDGAEEFLSDQIQGIDLGEIEWFHRIRNQLYHDGNGVTIESTKVAAYGGIAKSLFLNLFGFPVPEVADRRPLGLIGEFVQAWAAFVIELENRFSGEVDGKRWLPEKYIDWLSGEQMIPKEYVDQYRRLRNFRNNLVHGHQSPAKKELQSALNTLQKLHTGLPRIEERP